MGFLGVVMNVYKLMKFSACSLALVVALTGCAPKFNRTSGPKSDSANKTTTASTGKVIISDAIMKVEANSQGGTSAPLISTSYDLYKASVGGNMQKTKATSASYILNGGINPGL